jgi:hypothetical protein
VLGEQTQSRGPGLSGDTRAGSKAAMAAVANACRTVTLPARAATDATSVATTRTGAGASEGTATLYDCQGSASALVSAGG